MLQGYNNLQQNKSHAKQCSCVLVMYQYICDGKIGRKGNRNGQGRGKDHKRILSYIQIYCKLSPSAQLNSKRDLKPVPVLPSPHQLRDEVEAPQRHQAIKSTSVLIISEKMMGR